MCLPTRTWAAYRVADEVPPQAPQTVQVDYQQSKAKPTSHSVSSEIRFTQESTFKWPPAQVLRVNAGHQAPEILASWETEHWNQGQVGRTDFPRLTHNVTNNYLASPCSRFCNATWLIDFMRNGHCALFASFFFSGLEKFLSQEPVTVPSPPLSATHGSLFPIWPN
ncbi:hypothetical protein BJX68DRAFT_145623 [Aspergillus pseudodeflectus]|uniref:Uncharacterized protein n=1 Tax=Aspergillus pseudodeflectus TaxID=176178 RepID=A0ABR4L6F8_9EURO